MQEISFKLAKFVVCFFVRSVLWPLYLCYVNPPHTTNHFSSKFDRFYRGISKLISKKVVLIIFLNGKKMQLWELSLYVIPSHPKIHDVFKWKKDVALRVVFICKICTKLYILVLIIFVNHLVQILVFAMQICQIYTHSCWNYTGPFPTNRYKEFRSRSNLMQLENTEIQKERNIPILIWVGNNQTSIGRDNKGWLHDEGPSGNWEMLVVTGFTSSLANVLQMMQL